MLLTEDSPQSPSPPGLTVPLALHQCTSLYAASQIEQKESIPATLPGTSQNSSRKFWFTSRVGILADPVGAGKTLLALCLALQPLSIQQQSPYYTNEYISLFLDEGSIACNATLIVVPHGLLSMWVNQLETFMPSVKYQLVRTTKQCNEFTPKSDTDIVFVSSTRLRQFACPDGPGALNWKRVIFEEADTINLPSCPEINANFIWLITATPNNLFPYHRSTGFMRRLVSSLYILLHNELINHLIIRNEDKVIQKSIPLPEPIITNIECDLPPQLRNLRQFVSQRVLQALHADDIGSAIQLLACKADNKNNIIQAVKDNLEHNVSRLKAKIKYQESIGSSEERLNANRAKLSSAEEQLRNIIERLDSQDNCPICLDPLENGPIAMLPCCHHWYCISCLTQSISRQYKCPLCRSEATLGDMIADNSKQTTESTKEKPPSKTDCLLKLLKENKKTLVFSNYTNALINIESLLKDAEISFAHVKGTATTINKIIKRYRTGDLNVLLLNSSYQGSGHNLQVTDRVILMHHLETSTYKQVVGRAQRLGRKNPLEIVNILHTDEIQSNE
tara:strand:+ start:4657 stop:6342 length:1686 start_codon:yes stop_codon:yes gene_type:complete